MLRSHPGMAVSVYVNQRAFLQDSLTSGACHAQVTFMLDRFSFFFRSAPRPALLGLLLFFCAGFADGMLIPFFPLRANEEAGIPVGAIRLLFGCYAGGELVAAP